jgi:hypothetical protein
MYRHAATLRSICSGGRLTWNVRGPLEGPDEAQGDI